MCRWLLVPVFQLAGFFDKSYWYVTLTKEEKDMLKQQDMTETARVVFNELRLLNRQQLGKLRRILTFHANAAS